MGVGDTELSLSSAPLLVDSLSPTLNSRTKMVSCGGNQTAVVMNNGLLLTWGCGKSGATGLGAETDSFSPTIPKFSLE